MAVGFDTAHLREEWLPRLDQLLRSASFARDRYRVQGVYVCAVVLSQDEAEIDHLVTKMPFFSVTQDALDWQAEEDDTSAGAVFQHLMGMSAASEDCRKMVPSPDRYLLENVEAPSCSDGDSNSEESGRRESSGSFYRQSFRLSSLEVYNGECMSPGYHIGATDVAKLTNLRDNKVPDELWRKWLFKYIRDLDESPRIRWEQEGVKSAVLWQVQIDIIDSLYVRNSFRRIRQRRYGAFSQPYVEYSSPKSIDGGHDGGDGEEGADDAPDAKRFRGVRWRPERKTWVAEMRLPKGLKRNKVSFGDFKLKKQAARAVDVAFYHYGRRERVNFADTPQLLSSQPSFEGLDDEEKLKRVKAQAKWLALEATPTRCSPTSPTAETPDTSRFPTAGVCNFPIPSPSPAFSLDSLLVTSGSGIDYGSEKSSLVAPEFLRNEMGSLSDQPAVQSVFQFFCSVGSDPCDLIDSSSSESTDFFQMAMDSPLAYDSTDQSMQESFHMWSHAPDPFF